MDILGDALYNLSQSGYKVPVLKFCTELPSINMPSVVKISLRVSVDEGRKLQDTGLKLSQRENFQHSDLARWKRLHGGSELPTPGGM